MTLIVDTPSAGLEEIQRGAFYVLFHRLNDALEQVQASWVTPDEEFATQTGRQLSPVIMEKVDPENFHEGHRPSLIGAPIEKYPNVSVMAYRATPGPGAELYDHQSKYRVALVVEVMVKASPEDGEEVCNRRAQRMVQAAHICLMENPTLGKIISGFDGDPSLSVTELFTRKERTRHGPEWYWQGGRLEYAVRKEASLPSNGSSFRSVTYEGLDIDQM